MGPEIFESDKLFLFIAFVIPGFITYKTYELVSISGKTDDFGTKIVDAIAYSCINYAILGYFIFSVELSGINKIHPKLYAIFYIFVVLVFPVLLGLAWKEVRMSKFAQGSAPHPCLNSWDYVFSKRKSYYLILTLKSGEKIAGFFGPESFASSYPAEPEIFMEKEWLLNTEGGFEREVYETKGVLVLASNIQSISYYEA